MVCHQEHRTQEYPCIEICAMGGGVESSKSQTGASMTLPRALKRTVPFRGTFSDSERITGV